MTFSSGNGEVLFCFPFCTQTHMSFSLWSQRLMFATFAVDGRRHCVPQTTRRRSLRGDAAIDVAAMWLGRGGAAGVTADDAAQLWWLKNGEFCVAVFSLFKTKYITVALFSLKTKQEGVEFSAGAWGLALGVLSRSHMR